MAIDKKHSDKSEEYRRYAERAREIAKAHTDPKKREEWDDVADVWDRLANTENRIYRPEH